MSSFEAVSETRAHGTSRPIVVTLPRAPTDESGRNLGGTLASSVLRNGSCRALFASGHAHYA